MSVSTSPGSRVTRLARLAAGLLTVALALVSLPSNAAPGKATKERCHPRKGCAAPDTTPPSVVIDAPIAGTTVSDQVTVAGTASDDTHVSRVEVSVDGAKAGNASGTDVWDFVWDASTASPGDHTLTARAVDSAGNVSSTSVVVTVAAATPEPTPEPSPEPTPEPTPDPEAGPDPTPDPEPSPDPEPEPTDDPAPDTQGSWVSPEGVTIEVDSSGAWTVRQIHTMLLGNALDLDLLGPNLTIRVQDVYGSQMQASASTTAGVYTGFRATIYLMGVGSTFAARPDDILAHEYGHAWADYHLYVTHQGAWSSYLDTRWSDANGSPLGNDPRLDSGPHQWGRGEIIADDYRLLFGSADAIAQRDAHLNGGIPDPRAQAGLREFLLTTWREG